MDEKTQQKLANLIQLELDGLLSDAQFAEISSILKSSPQARRYYARTISMIALFRSSSSFQRLEIDIDESFDSALWQALSQDEKQADPIQIEKTPQQPERVTNVRQRKAMLKEKSKPLPPSVWAATAALAAMLLMVLYVYVRPPLGYEVATITDSIDLQWSSSIAPRKGGRLMASSELIEVQRGIVRLRSDKGVTVLLEAPAQFRFAGTDEIVLTYGRLFADVSENGGGFAVQTGNSKIIDLGTRFGVYADVKGETELHMFDGKALVIAGGDQNPKQPTTLSSGRALRVDHTGQTIADIPLRQDVFAQNIDSLTGLIWRGRKVIHLADVVGGGNGFGTGDQGVGINPVSGAVRKAEVQRRKHSNVYTPVDSNIFVDGVFIPNGTDEQVVTTAGHVFAECPPTSGYFYADISNTSMGRMINDQKHYPLYLNQINYASKDNPCIFMHSNTGITFDLHSFRSRLPGTRIVRFQSEIGVSDSAPNKLYIADFWVLIDGQVRYTNVEPMHRGEAVEVNIEIYDQDRFLTLMVTDGSVREGPQDENAIRSDWGLFGRPLLILQ